jgi:hypothetical protein
MRGGRVTARVDGRDATPENLYDLETAPIPQETAR